MVDNKFIKNTFLIAISQVLLNLSSFILLPIITKALGPADYGIWSIITVTVSLISPFALLGLSSGAIRFLSAEKDINVIKDDFYSIVLFVLGTGFFLSLCIFLLSEVIAESIFNDFNYSFLIQTSSWLILFSALSQVTINYFRIFNQIKLFSIFQLSQGLGKLFLIYLFLHFGYGLLGIVIGALITQSILVIVSLSIVVYQIGFHLPHFARFKHYITFSLPLSLNPALRWISESSDRYLIAFFLSSTSVGIYSATYAIGNLIQLLVMPIQITLFPEVSRLYDEGKLDEVKQYFKYSIKIFLLLATPAFFGLTALSEPIILILTTSQFLEGASIIPLIALSGILVGLFQIYINITLLFKKSHYNFFLFMIPAIINIGLNFILIPQVGIIGAAIATVLSYFTILILCLEITGRFLKFDVELRSYAKILLSSIVMYFFVSSNTPSTLLGLIAFIIIGIVIYLICIFILKTLNQTELKILKNIFK